jgi:hypothetical protein
VATQPVEEGSGSQVTARQWILLGVLGAVLLVVLGVLVIRPLLAGRDAGGGTAPQAQPPATAPTPTTTTTATPGSATAPEGSATRVMTPVIAARTAKDPFVPLANATSSTAAGAGSSGSSGSSGSGSSGGSSGSGSSGGSSAKDRLTLVAVAGSGDDASVTISVDGTRYTGGVGDTLAGTYEVVSVTTECADFRADGEVFTACQRDTADK